MSAADKPQPEPQDIFINGIVAARDQKPYIQLTTTNGIMSQWNVTEARKIAHDILIMCSRTEADAMLIKFFGKMEFPPGAAFELMKEFRDYRHELDMMHVEGKDDIPE